MSEDDPKLAERPQELPSVPRHERKKLDREAVEREAREAYDPTHPLHWLSEEMWSLKRSMYIEFSKTARINFLYLSHERGIKRLAAKYRDKHSEFWRAICRLLRPHAMKLGLPWSPDASLPSQFLPDEVSQGQLKSIRDSARALKDFGRNPTRLPRPKRRLVSMLEGFGASSPGEKPFDRTKKIRAAIRERQRCGLSCTNGDVAEQVFGKKYRKADGLGKDEFRRQVREARRSLR